MTKLLIDADYTVYKCCASCEDEIDWGDDVIMVVSKFSEAMNAVKRDLTKIKNEFMWDEPELYCSSVTLRILERKFIPITRDIETVKSRVATDVSLRH